MVSRFVNKAKKQTDNPKIIENYNTLNGRIDSMKAIQEVLYKNSKTDTINLKFPIHKIATLSQKAFNQNKAININTNIKDIYISSKKAELIGLIVNELITNAYKYAFINKNTGNIRIKAFIKDKNIVLLINDDGIGFPKDFNKHTLTSYGLKLIKGLTKQLGGTITFSNTKNGTETTLTIPYI